MYNVCNKAVIYLVVFRVLEVNQCSEGYLSVVLFFRRYQRNVAILREMLLRIHYCSEDKFLFECSEGIQLEYCDSRVKVLCESVTVL